MLLRKPAPPSDEGSVTYLVGFLRSTLPPEWRRGWATPRPPAFFLKVTLLGLFLILNHLNLKFPNSSREFFEKMKGACVSIKREQRPPKAVSFQHSRFRVFPPNNGCLRIGRAQFWVGAAGLFSPLGSARGALPSFLTHLSSVRQVQQSNVGDTSPPQDANIISSNSKLSLRSNPRFWASWVKGVMCTVCHEMGSWGPAW